MKEPLRWRRNDKLCVRMSGEGVDARSKRRKRKMGTLNGGNTLGRTTICTHIEQKLIKGKDYVTKKRHRSCL